MKKALVMATRAWGKSPCESFQKMHHREESSDGNKDAKH
jgi:hypothetical protein